MQFQLSGFTMVFFFCRQIMAFTQLSSCIHDEDGDACIVIHLNESGTWTV
jgi:hypothetical protein